MKTITKDPRLVDLHQELGIPEDFAESRGLVFYDEAPIEDLVVVDIDYNGKPLILTKDTAKRWRELAAAAQADEIVLKPYSGFRSYVYQSGLIKQQLKRERTLDDILMGVAIPGCSEHHTGRAVDINTENCRPMNEEFQETKAFEWLKDNSSRFKIIMSFPRDNPYGYVYEPWHWCFSED